MQNIILPELEKLKKQTDFIINNKEILENKDIEKYLRSLEEIRYEMFSKIKINNRNSINEDEKISYINNLYKATLVNDILKIHIPEALPKFKNISNYSYKNIMLNTAESVKEYKGVKYIDNKYVKPIIDALVLQNIIQDDNITNMFYLAQGRNDTKKPFTEVFVMSGEYMQSWIEKLQKMS